MEPPRYLRPSLTGRGLGESLMKNKEFWKTVIQIIVTVLTALTTTLGVSACAL